MSKLWQFEAIGTKWSIQAELTVDVRQNILKRIAEFDQTYSRFRADSIVTQMAQHAGNYTLPADSWLLIDFYQQLYQLTDGAVTPLIGHTLEQAGYDANYSLQPSILTASPSWQEAIEYTYPVITVHRPILLDFGAAGKGYLVDIISAMLVESGIQQYVINAGGDIVAQGSATDFLLEDPHDTARAIGQVTVVDGALCGSSGNRRAWGEFTHILNPKTLQSPKNVEAVWVRAQSCMVADGLATALFFVDPQTLLRQFDFSYVIIRDGNLEYSDNFKAEFFTHA